MTWTGWLQAAAFLAVLLGLTQPIGNYMYRVFESETPPLLGAAERRLLRWLGVRGEEQSWQAYAASLLLFSALGLGVTYAVQRLQGVLPLNPQNLPAVEPLLAFNTAVSFVTNTNWQSYAGETTMSYFTQMTALAWQNFMSAAVGMGAALVLARGLTRRLGEGAAATVGNFWVDTLRATLFVLLPLSVVAAVWLVWQGVPQTLEPYHTLTTLQGAQQTLALGPVASQEAIKQVGTNGGGFFNANSAHPFENPTPLSNFVQMLLILAIPAGLTATYGRMARDRRQGWVLWAAMAVLLCAGVAICYSAESQVHNALSGVPMDARAGNMEGKETRFGVAASALFATVTTAASCGAVNAAHDSFTPLGGLVPLLNIQLGEVIFGGVGAGLYGMLIFVVLAVFMAGLMVGRTPEYLGKKIEGREMKLAMLYVLIFPLLILGLSAAAVVLPQAVASLGNAGPHGVTETLYAYTSATGNNGSAFAGLNANVPWWNITLAVAMLIGRFGMMVPILALGGSMVAKRVVPEGPGTFPTHGALFTGLLVAVVVIVGALTFFPALCLGPVAEHLSGKVY